MFCGEISSVSNTRIAVGKVFPCKIVNAEDKLGRQRTFKQPYGKALQLTIYSNQIGLARNPMNQNNRYNTAMVLPFPIIPGEKNRFQIFSMQEYGNIFDDFEMLFPELPDRNPISTDLLTPTMNIGSYAVKVAKDFQSLESLDTPNFKVSKDLLNLAKKYYPRNFGFIVCILKTNAQYHPIGYVHEIRHDGKLFIPTRHHHVQDTTSKYSMNQFSGYREWHSGQDGEIDLGDSSDYRRNSTVELEDHFQDTILQEDKWMRYQVRRIDHDIQTVDIGWDHYVFIINHNPSNIKNIEQPLPDRIANVYSYLSMNLMPKQITFGGVKSVYRIVFPPTSPGNGDLYC
jgi:hypothetical protein